jgi:hypothetical protein
MQIPRNGKMPYFGQMVNSSMLRIGKAQDWGGKLEMTLNVMLRGFSLVLLAVGSPSSGQW